jgi:excisionase family DNA binding protein
MNEHISATAEPYLTKPQAATYLSMSQRGLQDWMKRRMVPYFKIKRAVRFRRSDLDAVLDQRFRVASKS